MLLIITHGKSATQSAHQSVTGLAQFDSV